MIENTNNTCSLLLINPFRDDSAKFRNYPERSDYLKYKQGILNPNNFSDKLRYEIFELLEKMGLSFDSLGFYYYKDVIVRIIKRLEWLDTDGYYFVLGEIDSSLLKDLTQEEINICVNSDLNRYLEFLKEELINPYSQFYFDIARNDNDIATKTMHNYINKSFECMSGNKIKLFNCEDGKVNYGNLAFEIAEYIRGLDFYKNTTDDREKLKPMSKVKLR